MGGEWKNTTFGDAVCFVAEKAKAGEAVLESYVSTENMVVDFGGITVAETLPSSGSVSRFMVGDTLFSNIRTYFKKVWQAKFDGCCSNDVLVFRSADEGNLLADYLYQVCRWIRFTEFSVRTSKGAKMPRGDKGAIAQFQFPLPTLNEQRAIAHILGSLDDKVELNRRMNATLLAMAQAIFKSWFFDFDPVRAKASGEPSESICRRLGIPAEFLAYFPSRLSESELGEIPEGWDVTTLGELCERVSMGPFGSDIKTSNFVAEGVPIIRGGNLTSGFVDDKFVFLTETKADELRNANARAGDIVITHRGTLGQVGLIPSGSRYPRYVVSQSQMVLTVKKERATSRFIYEFLRSPTGLQALLANTSQVGVPAIARPTTSVKAILLLAPPLRVLNAFDALVGPFFEYVDHMRRNSEVLAALRDVMLPKLLSGELRVPTKAGA